MNGRGCGTRAPEPAARGRAAARASVRRARLTKVRAGSETVARSVSQRRHAELAGRREGHGESGEARPLGSSKLKRLKGGLKRGNRLGRLTADEVYASVLRFLDQLIGRGAEPDIIELRAQLASDQEVRRLLDAQLPSRNVSEREAFDAMRAFFEAMWERSGRPSLEGAPALVDLIAWTSWDSAPVNVLNTADPAQWHDWLVSTLSPETAEDAR